MSKAFVGTSFDAATESECLPTAELMLYGAGDPADGLRLQPLETLGVLADRGSGALPAHCSMILEWIECNVALLECQGSFTTADLAQLLAELAVLMWSESGCLLEALDEVCFLGFAKRAKLIDGASFLG